MNIKRNAYSLIELLIVVSIIVLFSGLSLAYYWNYDEQRKLDAASKQVLDVLNLAAKKAFSQDLEPNQGCTIFQGYRVRVDSETTYKLDFYCQDSFIQVQNHSLPPGMIFTSGIGTSVIFKPLTQGTNLSIPVEIQISNPSLSSGSTRDITICPVGIFFEKEGSCF